MCVEGVVSVGRRGGGEKQGNPMAVVVEIKLGREEGEEGKNKKVGLDRRLGREVSQ